MRYPSVLNTDAFDIRRYQEIKDMSSKLQQLEDEGKELIPSFPSLMGDIWASLYKMKPKVLDDVKDGLQTNKTIMEHIMADESFQQFQETTRLDDLTSAIGSVKFSEKTQEWLVLQEKQNQQMQQAMEEIRNMQKQIQQEKLNMQQNEQNGLSTDKNQKKVEKKQKSLQQAIDELDQQLQQGFNYSFSQALSGAARETKEAKDGLTSLVDGLKAGSGEAELQKVPLRDKIKLAEILADNPKIKKIAQWAGRFKSIARKKQKSKSKDSIEHSGVTMGNSVEKLLPMELGFYSSPATKMDFLRRFAEGQTMVYDQKGKEELGKGPIILCLDQSGSMSSLDNQSKGFALALMSIARKQKRDFAMIPFSRQAKKYVYKKGKITPFDMVEMATNFLGGGTMFDRPLEYALGVIEDSRFRKADIIFVTDGEADLRKEFVENFNKKKQEKAFGVLSVVLGCENTSTVRQFSDTVVRASNLMDENALKAFEI